MQAVAKTQEIKNAVNKQAVASRTIKTHLLGTDQSSTRTCRMMNHRSPSTDQRRLIAQVAAAAAALGLLEPFGFAWSMEQLVAGEKQSNRF
ncbi:hypothetical protein ZHAS_00021908 [Anopheles sinensis]|uniref:Uncharacterized protein n=1 Tax=Anopheles sinensis TaxID=74873 RepID=A0A084WTW7_ANOSI|nr:hypothetical protein ZHAS_00021908 [Anopheles sinensis]